MQLICCEQSDEFRPAALLLLGTKKAVTVERKANAQLGEVCRLYAAYSLTWSLRDS